VFESRITELLKTTEDNLHGVFHDIFVFIFLYSFYNLLSINVNNIWIEIIWEIAVSSIVLFLLSFCDEIL
jgi:hypothetical protein